MGYVIVTLVDGDKLSLEGVAGGQIASMIQSALGDAELVKLESLNGSYWVNPAHVVSVHQMGG